MELADEAFLRRIRYKIFIDYPSKEDFEVIFRKACEMKNVAFDPKAFQFLQDIYEKLGIQRAQTTRGIP
jgi:SpoVK/Ycf46/Vps4 family AAA+-type ATPase